MSYMQSPIINVRTKPYLRRQLEKLAAKEHTTLSQIVRRALWMLVEKEKEKK